MRWFLAVFLTLLSSSAWAAKPKVRTSAAPSLGVGVLLHPKVALRATGGPRFRLAGPSLGDKVGLSLSPGLHVFAHPVLGVSLHYRFASGEFPLDGPGRTEHSVIPGLRLGGGGERFVVANLARLELRNLWIDGVGRQFWLRPRDTLRLTAIVRRWFQTSLETEVLLSPREGMGRTLQLRSGLALHGEIPLGPPAERGKRPTSNLYWITATGIGLTPVALARGYDGAVDTRIEAQRADQASTLDIVLTAGLAVVF